MTNFCTEPDFVFFIPGYLSGVNEQDSALSVLERIYDKSKVQRFCWDSVTSWEKAKRNTRRAGEDLNSLLKNLENKSVILIGHSLGCRVILYALLKGGVKVTQIIFMGAAINCDDTAVLLCPMYSQFPVINLFNNQDAVLSTFYPVYEHSSALGLVGAVNKDLFREDYFDVPVSVPVVKAKTADNWEIAAEATLGILGHDSASIYLPELKKLVLKN